MKSREKTTEQLEEDLRKTREELAIQKWGTEKTLGGMKVLVKELIQKGKEVEKFKLAVDNVSDQIIITDPDATVLYINNATETITGYAQEEVVGKKAGKLWGNLMERSFYENLWKTIKIDKKIFIGEIMNQRKNSQTYIALISISPIINKNGEIEFFVGIEHDITKEKEIDRLKRDFMSLASHQLRTPLTGMEWTAEIFAKKEELTDQGKQYLQDIRFSAHRLNALVKLLLNASRVEAGKVEIKPETVDVVSFIQELIKKSEVLCEKKKLTLFFPKHSPKLVALTDLNLLEQIFQNILSNALEYTLAGGKITVSLEEKKETFIFIVEDTGIGIPKKEQARIFERFIRASNATSIKPDGTGLGLYIVAEAAKLLGGKVWFESEESRGSIFYAELPLQTRVKEGENKLIDHTLSK